MAEGALRAVAERTGLVCQVDSAGTANYHVGDKPDFRAVETALADGVDISRQSARQLKIEDFYRFTHIFALDTANLAGINAKMPRDATAKVALLMNAAEHGGTKSIKDPYHGTDDDFRDAWNQILIGVAAIEVELRARGVSAEF